MRIHAILKGPDLLLNISGIRHDAIFCLCEVSIEESHSWISHEGHPYRSRNSLCINSSLPLATILFARGEDDDSLSTRPSLCLSASYVHTVDESTVWHRFSRQ